MAAKKVTRTTSPERAPAPLRPPRARRTAAQPGGIAFSPTFSAQRASASSKDLLLFDLQRARVAVNAALQGVAGGAAERPVRPGGWTIRQVVLHLVVRDRVRLEEFDAALAGTPVSWSGIDHDAMAALNETHLAPLRDLSWDESVRLLQTTRAQLLERLVSLPPEPDEVWTDRHAFGAMLRMLPPHDRLHADQIKTARIRG